MAQPSNLQTVCPFCPLMFPEPFWQVLIKASHVIRSTWNNSILRRYLGHGVPTPKKGHLPSQTNNLCQPPRASCAKDFLRAFCQRGPKELRQAFLEMRSGVNSSRPQHCKDLEVDTQSEDGWLLYVLVQIFGSMYHPWHHGSNNCASNLWCF